jgi:hypothetical protein
MTGMMHTKEPTTVAARAARREFKADMKALRAINAQTQKKLDKALDNADALKRAIKRHYNQVHAHNWGADDELWAVVGLEADPEVIG